MSRHPRWSCAADETALASLNTASSFCSTQASAGHKPKKLGMRRSLGGAAVPSGASGFGRGTRRTGRMSLMPLQESNQVMLALRNNNKQITSRCESDPAFSARQPHFLDDLLAGAADTQPVAADQNHLRACIHDNSDVEPWMREVVGSWMCDVSKELHFDPDVHPRALQLLDRFLQRRPINRTCLQLMGAACMLVASKLVEYAPVTLEKLVHYADYSVNKNQILNAELLVCSAVKFDTCGVTSLDMIFPVCHLLNWEGLSALHTPTQNDRLRRLTCELIRDQLHAVQSLLFTPSEWAAGSLLSVYCRRLLPESSQLPTCTTLLQQDRCTLAYRLSVLMRLDYRRVLSAQEQVNQLADKRDMGAAILCAETHYTPTDTRDVQANPS